MDVVAKSILYNSIWTCLFFSLLLSSGTSRAGEGKPNVVFIVSDDQGWADIGYNNPNVYSPNLDLLAAEGVTLTQNYVMPQCTPTRVALMTGRYPSRFGKHALQASNQPAFPKGTPTLASMFRDCGYETFLCGKWHLGSSPDHGPNHFGFDHSYGSLTGAVGMYDHRYRKGKFENTWHRNHQLITGSENGTHATDLVISEAVSIVKSERDKPFFLYLPLHSVHTPLDERGTFTDRPTQLDPQNEGRWLDESKIKWFNDPQGLIQKEKDPEKRLFLAAVNHLDAAIGRVVDALESTGQRPSTIIVFSSDNGPQGSWGGNAYPDDLKLTQFNQSLPMKGKKLDVWEGGIRVPGFINWPGKLKAARFDDPIHIIDWFPTFAKLLGYPDSSKVQFDGRNVWPALTTGEPLGPRSLYWNWNSKINRWAVRYGNWKVVKYGHDVPKAMDWKLFDLSSDQKEAADLSKLHPEKIEELHQFFNQHREKDFVRPKK